jgi:hypothetical protein
LLSDNDGNGFAVAKDHEFSGVFHSAKSPSAHFKAKALAFDQAFDILDRAAQYATFCGGAGAEKLYDPTIQRSGVMGAGKSFMAHLLSEVLPIHP